MRALRALKWQARPHLALLPYALRTTAIAPSERAGKGTKSKPHAIARAGDAASWSVLQRLRPRSSRRSSSSCTCSSGHGKARRDRRLEARAQSLEEPRLRLAPARGAGGVRAAARRAARGARAARRRRRAAPRRARSEEH